MTRGEDFVVRKLEPSKSSDIDAFKASIAKLQDIEAEFDDRLLPSEVVVTPWVDHIFKENEEHGGEVFLVEATGAGPVGFMWAKILSSTAEDEIWQKPSKTVYLYDMHVQQPFRDRGAGSLLLEQAVVFAREKNIDTITVDNYAGNTTDAAFFSSEGFEDAMVRMVKKLPPKEPHSKPSSS